MKENLKKLCLSLAHNKPIYAVAMIAVCKAIMRPLYCLMDKEQPKENRHYAALRDFITELVAIPSYIVMSNISGRSAKYLAIIPEKATKAIKQEKISNVKDVVQFLAIAGTATVIIPSLCNLVLPYAMSTLKKHEKKQITNNPQVQKLDISTGDELRFKNSLNNQFDKKYNLVKQSTLTNTSGMRIGS